MKECFIITTYCNTEEKLLALNRTIENIKQYELPIFIHAHYPLSDNIQKKAHSYFYSSENPIIKTRWNIFWYFTDKYKLEIKVHDYFFTVLKAWKESIRIMDDYDRIHMINYDTNLYPELFALSKKYDDKSLFLENVTSQPQYMIDNVTYINTLYFCLNKKSFNFFIENITLEKYLSFPLHTQFLPLVEEIISSFTIGEDFFHIPMTEYSVERLFENDIISDTRFNWNKSLSLNDTKIFIGEMDGSAKILFFDVEKSLKIDVIVNDKVGSFNVESTQIFDLELPFNKITSIGLRVNNQPVDEDLIKTFFKLECKIYPL